MAAHHPHRCDDTCVCPEHGTTLLHAPAAGDHACQDPDCQHGQGGFDPGAALLAKTLQSRAGRR
ncbi:hypothetical protein [Kitasatospora sp. NPDC058046]|uniref:hypothetical protein n=1 Tax=Kitasatospora sp. NPDC058046 TaxID=3346312 RepID=UPI0036DB3AF7